MMLFKINRVIILIAVLFLSACATTIKPENTQNSPPIEIFSNFTAFELKPVTLAPAFSDSSVNQKALIAIQKSIDSELQPVFDNWNKTETKKDEVPRTLVIEPVVTEIKFINGATRFFAGALAGSSAVIIRATVIEKETGKVIASPEFYARANAWGGAFTIGATDNYMLTNIAHRMTEYFTKNYDTLVGGPTGEAL